MTQLSEAEVASLIKSIRKIQIKPGESLVFQMHSTPSQEDVYQAAIILANWLDVAPRRILVIGPGEDLGVVSKITPMFGGDNAADGRPGEGQSDGEIGECPSHPGEFGDH